MCTVLLPPCDNLIAVNKYIISYTYVRRAVSYTYLSRELIHRINYSRLVYSSLLSISIIFRGSVKKARCEEFVLFHSVRTDVSLCNTLNGWGEHTNPRRHVALVNKFLYGGASYLWPLIMELASSLLLAPRIEVAPKYFENLCTPAMKIKFLTEKGVWV